MSAPIPFDKVKAIYRAAIDPQVRDTEVGDWWDQVSREVQTVVDAPGLAQAASVIEWWHRDWTMVNDSPKAAARRIRSCAKRVALQTLA